MTEIFKNKGLQPKETICKSKKKEKERELTRAKILDLFTEKQTKLTVSLITKELGISHYKARFEILKMENLGQLQARKAGKIARVFILPEQPKEKKDPGLTKNRRDEKTKDVKEKFNKAENQINNATGENLNKNIKLTEINSEDILRSAEELIKKRAGLTDMQISKALNIKNKPDLTSLINSLKEADTIIFTYKLSQKNPVINFFLKGQIGDEKDPEKVKEIMINLIKERRIREFEELKAQRNKF